MVFIAKDPALWIQTSADEDSRASWSFIAVVLQHSNKEPCCCQAVTAKQRSCAEDARCRGWPLANVTCYVFIPSSPPSHLVFISPEASAVTCCQDAALLSSMLMKLCKQILMSLSFTYVEIEHSENIDEYSEAVFFPHYPTFPHSL